MEISAQLAWQGQVKFLGLYFIGGRGITWEWISTDLLNRHTFLDQAVRHFWAARASYTSLIKHQNFPLANINALIMK